MIQKLKQILKLNGYTGEDMAKKMGLTYGTYRSLTRKSATTTPKWVTGFMIGYEMAKNEEKLKNIEVNEPEQL